MLTNKISAVQYSVERILQISNNSIIVLEINKDIVELQRDVTVFGQGGSTTIFAKMMTTHDSIKSRLEEVRRQTENDELLNTIQNMKTLVVRYGENLGFWFSCIKLKVIISTLNYRKCSNRA
ncbi:hypothetical protein [Psychrosphaera algicola]|uniref:Uncharacterized protein n=1 Tax=Psychrosphaera algicola TaxID=3023714 RepID=A0ABT5FFG4_9GAMM|nr:hypothetical protein [Psychrosphaera sp. G1-22]MDC2890296.1 hypothetical protein [Psychrosphaera sp. G1-22]